MSNEKIESFKLFTNFPQNNHIVVKKHFWRSQKRFQSARNASKEEKKNFLSRIRLSQKIDCDTVEAGFLESLFKSIGLGLFGRVRSPPSSPPPLGQGPKDARRRRHVDAEMDQSIIGIGFKSATPPMTTAERKHLSFESERGFVCACLLRARIAPRNCRL